MYLWCWTPRAEAHGHWWSHSGRHRQGPSDAEVRRVLCLPIGEKFALVQGCGHNMSKALNRPLLYLNVWRRSVKDEVDAVRNVRAACEVVPRVAISVELWLPAWVFSVHLDIIWLDYSDQIIFTSGSLKGILHYLKLGIVHIGEHDLVRRVAAILLKQTEKLASFWGVHIWRIVQVTSPYLLNTIQQIKACKRCLRYILNNSHFYLEIRWGSLKDLDCLPGLDFPGQDVLKLSCWLLQSHS